jgi:hypothetical protein
MRPFIWTDRDRGMSRVMIRISRPVGLDRLTIQVADLDFVKAGLNQDRCWPGLPSAMAIVSRVRARREQTARLMGTLVSCAPRTRACARPCSIKGADREGSALSFPVKFICSAD